MPETREPLSRKTNKRDRAGVRWIVLAHLALLACLPVALPAQGQLSPDDESIYATAVDPTEFRGHDYVSLLDLGQVRAEADGTSSYTIRQVIQILTDDGAAAWGEFSFPYDPSRQDLRINWMRVVDDDGTVREGPQYQQESSPIVDPSAPVYRDTKIVQATLAGVRAGVTVDYSLTIETREPRLVGDFHYTWGFDGFVPVLQSTFELDTPADFSVRLDDRFPRPTPTDVTESGRHIRTWTAHDLAAVELEPYAGFPNDILMSVEVSGPVSWDGIGRWYANLLRDRYELPEEVLAEHASELAGAQTLEDSLRATQRWVAQDFRYVSLSLGDGGYQPRLLQEVYETRFGDCKDVTALFIGLVRDMGLPAYPVLVNSEGGVDSLMPSLSQFDHMIAAVERDGGTEFLDLTSRLSPYGEIPPGLQGEIGVLLRDDGDTDVVVLPTSDPSDNRWEQGVAGSLGLDNGFVGSLSVFASGTEQYDLRNQFYDFDEMDERDREDLLSQAALSVWESAVVDSSRVLGGRDLGAQPELTVWFTVADLLGQVGGQYILYLPLLDFTSTAAATSLASSPERRFPIDVAQVNSPAVWRSTIDIELPQGWIVTLPEDVSIEGAFGYYEAEYSQAGRRLRARREMGGARGLLPPDSLSALVDWLQGVSEDDAEYVVIDPSAGLRVGVSPQGASAGGLSDVLLTAEDLGVGATLASDGVSDLLDMIDMASVEPIRAYGRDFVADQMLFPVGSSQYVLMSVGGTEYRTEEEATKGQRTLELMDLGMLFGLVMEEMLGAQASINEVREMELPLAGSAARGWALEFVTPISRFDIVLATLVRGRVIVSLFGIGALGVEDADLDDLLAIMDARVRASAEYLTDLEPEAGEDVEEELDRAALAESAEGLALADMLPSSEDFPGSVTTGADFYIGNGVPVFARELEGRGFTFTVGDTEALSMSLDVILLDSEAWAVKAALLAGRGDLDDAVEAMGDDFIGSLMFGGDGSSLERVPAPDVGGLSTASIMRLRSAFRMDMGMLSLSLGRLTANILVTSPAGALRMEDVGTVAEDVAERMRAEAPEMTNFEPSDDLIAAVERVIEVEEEVERLMSTVEFDAVFSVIDRADLGDAPVTLEPETWEAVCWLGALNGHAERALPACEEALVPDPDHVSRRDSRGLVRALLGDIDGAIQDFSHVVENSPDSEFLIERSGWLDELLAGENPFTEEVLAGLRNGDG